ncbi:MAG: DsbA family protein [Chloroflexi bacterium]|nr:DsbA family protein [Chloroflexota bacterium]
MDRLDQEGDVTIEWHAFELRPASAPPLPPEMRAGIEARRPQFVERARVQYGLAINSGPFDVDSRLALIGEQIAKAEGAGRAYHDAVMRAYWLEAAVIDDRAVLADLAASVGLDRAAFLAALDDPAYEQAMLAEAADAHDAGITAVPALVFDERYLVLGAQPYDLLRQVVDQCRAEQADAAG